MAPAYCWWETFLTDHQAYTTAELARVAGSSIEVFCVEEENAIRKRQGWTNIEQRDLEMRPFPKRWLQFVWRAIRDRRGAIHVFAGPFGSVRLTVAMFIAVMRGRRVFLLTEPYSPIPSGYFDDRARIAGFIKSKIRPALYRFYGFIFAKRIQGVFAISTRAITQVRAMGFEPARIFPFGYFVPPAATADEPNNKIDHSFGMRLIFVGTLNQTKGLDILVRAADMLRARGVQFTVDVYGHGDKSEFGLDTSAVRYRGPIPFGESQRIIAGYDFLVLPSRYDGWGVVVNEALMAGVPVICSDGAGASAMVKRWDCGIVYMHRGPLELAAALETAITDMTGLQRMREQCLKIRQSLSPRIAGQYLFAATNRRESSDLTIPNPWY